MKNTFFTIVFLLAAIVNYAQQKSDNPYVGKTFRIDNYIGDKLDNSEDLTFTETVVEGSICLEYGFTTDSYTVKKNSHGNWEFGCIMLSKEHGKMVWQGEIEETKIKGKYLWTKEGQDPVNYTFKGKLKQ